MYSIRKAKSCHHRHFCHDLFVLLAHVALPGRLPPRNAPIMAKIHPCSATPPLPLPSYWSQWRSITTHISQAADGQPNGAVTGAPDGPFSDCFVPKKRRPRWTLAEKQRLVELVELDVRKRQGSSDPPHIDWESISKEMNRSENSCNSMFNLLRRRQERSIQMPDNLRVMWPVEDGDYGQYYGHGTADSGQMPLAVAQDANRKRHLTDNITDPTIVIRWSDKEIDDLETAVMLYGTRNWEQIAMFVGTRSAEQCCQRWHYFSSHIAARGAAYRNSSEKLQQLPKNAELSHKSPALYSWRECDGNAHSPTTTAEHGDSDSRAASAGEADHGSLELYASDSDSVASLIRWANKYHKVTIEASTSQSASEAEATGTMPLSMATDGSQQGPQRELVPTGEDSTHRAPSPAGPAWHTRGSGSIEWTPQEDMRLLDLVARYGRKWQKIQEHFNIGHSRGNYAECNATNMPSSGAREPRLRTSIELYRRFEKLYSDRIYHKGRWTKDEDRRLLDLIKEHGTQWVTISRILGTRSERQCRQRWIYTLRIRQLYEQSPQRQKGGGSVSAARSSLPQLRRGRWTKEEDEQLRRIVKELGGYPVPSWVLVSQRLGTRTDSQCCYRWHQYHSESARYRGTHPWSLEDDRIIWDHCRAIDKLRDSKRLDSEVNYDWSKLSHQLSIPQPTQAIRSRKYMLYRAAKRVAEARIDVDSTEGFEMVHRLTKPTSRNCNPVSDAAYVVDGE